ncbi:hypothetical protein FGB62_14g254 [Gracilaria domingensis]|nr:hypothetical protein FGB62_14g254 [Gracilaria domingensis]
MTRHIKSTLVVIQVLVLRQLGQVVLLKVHKRLHREGAISAAGDAGDASRVIDAHVLQVIQIRQHGVVHHIQLALYAGAFARHVQQIGRIVLAANHQRVARLRAKVADVRGALHQVAVGEAAFERAVHEDVVATRGQRLAENVSGMAAGAEAGALAAPPAGARCFLLAGATGGTATGGDGGAAEDAVDAMTAARGASAGAAKAAPAGMRRAGGAQPAQPPHSANRRRERGRAQRSAAA